MARQHRPACTFLRKPQASCLQIALEIPLSEIDVDALPRDRNVTEAAPMADLEHSVATAGLRQPIEVWELRSPRAPLRYGLISGFRRLSACRAPGHSMIPAFQRSPSLIPEAMADMVAENELRIQITPWEKGRFSLATVYEGHSDTPDAAGKRKSGQEQHDPFQPQDPGTAPQTRPLPPGHFAILDAWADMIRSGRAHAPKETALHEELIV